METEKIKIICGDCMESMKDIPDESINLVLMDPPYNIGKDKAWDHWRKVDQYVSFMGKVFKECERVLTPNGQMVFFHNDMAQISRLMGWLQESTGFHFNSFVVLDKGDFRAISWKNPGEGNPLRCWFNICEFALVYVKTDGQEVEWDQTGLERILPECFADYLNYMTDIKEYTGANIKQFNDICGYKSIASHWFYQDKERTKQPQPRFIQREDYDKIVSAFNLRAWDGFREYDDLRTVFEKLREENEEKRQQYEAQRYKHHLDADHCNVWRFKRDKGKNLHPCQKPVDILERFIRCHTDPGDVVLDCFAGSGSTGVACVHTGRNFVGIEKDPEYYNIAAERIAKERKEREENESV